MIHNIIEKHCTYKKYLVYTKQTIASKELIAKANRVMTTVITVKDERAMKTKRGVEIGKDIGIKNFELLKKQVFGVDRT